LECHPCNGIGWLPSPAVLEAMAKAIEVEAKKWPTTTRTDPAWDKTGWYGATMQEVARAAWEAQARHILERHEDL
jgi:hypothetical protein